MQGIGRPSAIISPDVTSFNVHTFINPGCLTRIPDASFQLIWDLRFCPDPDSGFKFTTAASASDAKNGMDDFFINEVQQDYTLSQCYSMSAPEYFSEDGINVGTQLYINQFLRNGFYLYRASVPSSSNLLPWYLDPTNTSYNVPDDWYLIEVEEHISGDSNKRIASITQYNTIQ